MPEDTNASQETPGASNSGSRRGRPSQTRNPNNRQSVHFVDPPPAPEPPSIASSFVSRDLSQASRLPSVLMPATTPDVDPSTAVVRQGPLNPSNLPDLTFDATRNHPKAPTGEDLLHPIHTSAEHPASVSVISSPVSTPIPPAVLFAQEERSYFNSDPSPCPTSDPGNPDSQRNQPGDSNRQPRSDSPGELPFSRRRGGGDPSDSRGGEDSNGSGTASYQPGPLHGSHASSQHRSSYQISSQYPDQSAYHQPGASSSRSGARLGMRPGAHSSAHPSTLTGPLPSSQHGSQSGPFQGAQSSMPPPNTRPPARSAYPPPRHIPTIQQPPLPVLPGTDSFITATPGLWEQPPPPPPPRLSGGSERDGGARIQPQAPPRRPPRDANAPARRGDDDFEVRRELPNPQPRGRPLPPGTYGP